MKMYTIFDHKAKCYTRPFFCLNDEIAHRTCVDLISDSSNEFARHPQDFSIFSIGDFDDSTGCTSPTNPACLFNLNELTAIPLHNSPLASTEAIST